MHTPGTPGGAVPAVSLPGLEGQRPPWLMGTPAHQFSPQV